MTFESRASDNTRFPDALFPRITAEAFRRLSVSRPDYMRWQRLAYQVMSDAFALGLDIPVRLLLIDHLERLPARIVGLLADRNVQKLLVENLRSVNAHGDVEALSRMSEHEIHDKLMLLDEHLSRAWTTPRQPGLQGETQTWCSDDPFHEVIRILRTHIESDIWMTELSNTPPLHALWRVHDLWPVYLLLWCYRNRALIRKKAQPRAVTDSTLAQEFEHCSLPAFDGETLGVVALPSFALLHAEGDAGADDENVIPLVGPYVKSSLGETERLDITDQFVAFATASRPLSKFWIRHRETAPTREELKDAAHLLESIPLAEIASRSRVLATALDVAFQVRLIDVAQPGELDRIELERISCLVLWLAKLLHDLDVDDGPRPQALRDMCAEPLYLQFNNSKYVIVAEELVDSSRRTAFGGVTLFEAGAASADESLAAGTIVRIDEARAAVGSPTLPSTLLHRIRGNRDASWTHHIFAMNSLLNRQLSSGLRERPVPPLNASTPPDLHEAPASTELRHEDAAWILMGFGGSLCQSMVSLTRADMVSVYWLNYAEDPPRLRHVAGYSRHFVHRAFRDEIVSAFDEATWGRDSKQPQVSRSECLGSLLYRVALNDTAEHLEGVEGAVWNGYPTNFRPACALAVPIRFGARVIGVLACNGMAPGQLSQALYAPMRKAAQLLGPFMHSTLLLRSIASMVHMVDTIPPMEWRRPRSAEGNSVDHLSRLLCNAFLTPVAQVWVSSLDANQFYLLSSSAGQIAQEKVVDFTILSNDDRKNERGFAELAVLDWKNTIGQEGMDVNFSDSAESSVFPKIEGGAFGDFVQGQYISGTNDVTVMPAARDVVRGTVIRFFDDFVNAREHRKSMFLEGTLRRVMSFALPHYERTSPSGEMVGRSRTIGVVTLYDRASGDLDNPARTGSGGYGLEWQPIVQYMQEIVPSILQQARLIETAIDRAHALVIHEAAKALDQVVDQSEKLFQQLHFLLNGQGRELVAQLVKFPPSGVEEKVLSAIWANIRTAGGTLQTLAAGNTHGNLRRIASRLKHVNAYAYLELDADEAAVRIDLAQDLFSRMRALFPNRGGAISTYVDIRTSLVIEVEPSLWERVISNALSNMGKYGEPDTYGVWVKGSILTIQNYAVYDPEKDSPPWRHLQYGIRGGASPGKPGDGYGLYIARDAAMLLGIKFEYKIIVASGNERRARYVVELDLASVVIR